MPSARTKPLLLHVGLGKCGSSTIQAGLRDYASWLKTRGYSAFTHYDLTDIRTAGIQTYARWHLPFETTYGEKARLCRDFDAQTAAATINATLHQAAGTPLLSSEWFTDSHVKRMQARLQFLTEITRGFTDISVIVYMRAPHQLFRSLFIQWFCPDFPVDSATFLRHFDVHSGADVPYSLNILRTIEEIEHALPNAKINLRILERSRLSGGIFRDFCQTAGIQDLPDAMPLRDRNQTLAPTPFALLYALRDRLDRETRQSLARLFKKHPLPLFSDSHLLLTATDACRILDAYADPIHDCARRYNPELDACLQEWYRDAEQLPDSLDGPRADLIAETAALYLNQLSTGSKASAFGRLHGRLSAMFTGRRRQGRD